jgi:hypothetical protein
MLKCGQKIFCKFVRKTIQKWFMKNQKILAAHLIYNYKGVSKTIHFLLKQRDFKLLLLIQVQWLKQRAETNCGLHLKFAIKTVALEFDK